MKRFTCEVCGGTYLSPRSDADVQNEAVALFGEIPPDDRATVCEPCWKEFMVWAKENGVL